MRNHRRRNAKTGEMEITPFTPEEEAHAEAVENPPPPTDDERIDEAFPQTDSARVIFEAFFELVNDVRALKTPPQQPINRAQLRDWFKGKLQQQTTSRMRP